MWPAWRMIAAGWVTLHELKTSWSIIDLLDANEALDEHLKAQAAAQTTPPKK